MHPPEKLAAAFTLAHLAVAALFLGRAQSQTIAGDKMRCTLD